jgi:hypothetical protein
VIVGPDGTIEWAHVGFHDSTPKAFEDALRKLIPDDKAAEDDEAAAGDEAKAEDAAETKEATEAPAAEAK